MEGIEKLVIGSGDSGANSWMPLFAAMNQNGGLGGNGGIAWLLALLLFGRGGFGGGWGAAGAAAVANNCQDYLAIINAIAGVKDAVNSGVSTTISNVDQNTQRVSGIVTAGFANESVARSDQTANITNQFNGTRTEVASGFARLESILQALNTLSVTQFNSQATLTTKGFTDLGSDLCKLENTLLSTMNCNTNSLSKEIAAGVGQLSAQNVALSGQIKDLKCDMDGQFKDTNCLIEKSTGIILARIDKLEYDTKLAAKDARIAELEAEKEHGNRTNIIAIGNTVGNLVTVVNSLVARLGSNNFVATNPIA